MKPPLVRLYDSTRDEGVDAPQIKHYIEKTFNTRTQLSGDFWTSHAVPADTPARFLASMRVTDPLKKELDGLCLKPEVDFEKKRLADARVRSGGVFYDGVTLMSLCWRLIPREERRMDACHLILTSDLFGSWDPGDMRWHARPVLLGYPSLVSTTGIVEGPARPREFYAMRAAGADEAALKLRMQGEFIDYLDPRMTEVLKGYCAQSVYHFMTGEAFCGDAGCRLYNAHWQREVIHAQLESRYQFCEFHRGVIEKVTGASDRDLSGV